MRRATLLALAVSATLLGTAWWGWHWWSRLRFTETTDNAFVEAEIVTVAAQLAGRVRELRVGDNEEVAAGAVVAVLDEAEFRARAEQARAQAAFRRAALDAAERRLALQHEAIEQAKAGVLAAEAERRRAAQDRSRYAALAEQASASRQRLDLAAAEAAKAEAALALARSLETAERHRVALLAAERAQAQAALDEAEAALRLAELDLEKTVVRVPRPGTVGNRHARVGQYVRPGTPLLSLVPAEVHVVANFKETQLERMRVGGKAELTVDAFPGKRFDAVVESLAPASGARFSLLPPENATGNFVKIVQRLPVRLKVVAPEGEGAARLRPGLSVAVRVDTRP